MDPSSSLDPPSCGNAPGIFLEINNSRHLFPEINSVPGFGGVGWVISFKAIADYFLETWGPPGGWTQELIRLPLQKGVYLRARCCLAPGDRVGSLALTKKVPRMRWWQPWSQSSPHPLPGFCRKSLRLRYEEGPFRLNSYFVDLNLFIFISWHPAPERVVSGSSGNARYTE